VADAAKGDIGSDNGLGFSCWEVLRSPSASDIGKTLYSVGLSFLKMLVEMGLRQVSVI